ncbi:NUDIX domain-containing protein [Asticcacaulis sp. 201]|uniref:NUDIX domain-containing protein n=1 Tax=Asticcacaulis sp. 201 TaxID=3028787 RepID=UPI00291624A2|nr:NUDIX domain-containing protein [Asticcacaulis sp. 201]MDV6330869.1 NUDIX domain-containing protein [Asticcacaulis sp. 201]
MSEYDFAVIASPFAPVTPGELALIETVGMRAGAIILVIEGADIAPSVQMPWTAEERESLLRAGLGEESQGVLITSVRDHRYRPDLAAAALRSAVEAIAGPQSRILKVGGIDVEEWDYSEAPDFSADAEDMRGAFFNEGPEAFESEVPDAMADILMSFDGTPGYLALYEEQVYVEAYRDSWEAAPYPATLVTVDVIIIASDRILLVKRGAMPGRGQWALPGGFIDVDETLVESALRELQEETGLDLTEVAFELVAREVFDDPKRSSRGRVITHAFVFRLDGELPDVAGADDAETATWLPLVELPALRGHFFEDHGAILDHFGLLPPD